MIDQTKIVIDNPGYGICNFSIAKNSTPYFLVIKFGNAIETLSATAIQFTLGGNGP